jgi:hypothetical protein
MFVAASGPINCEIPKTHCQFCLTESHRGELAIRCVSPGLRVSSNISSINPCVCSIAPSTGTCTFHCILLVCRRSRQRQCPTGPGCGEREPRESVINFHFVYTYSQVSVSCIFQECLEFAFAACRYRSNLHRSHQCRGVPPARYLPRQILT